MDNLLNIAKASNPKLDETKVRLVTFQSKEITSLLANKGTVKTLIPFKEELPKKYSRPKYNEVFVECKNQVVKYDPGNDDIEKKAMFDPEFKRVIPFNAYKEHCYMDGMHKMSIHTIYRLASHFASYMGFDERDIIELDVPESEILFIQEDSMSVTAVLPYLKMDWVVSILKFNRYMDDVVQHELSLLYTNLVYSHNTYRMCYSEDILLNGHGYGDIIEQCMCGDIIPGITDVRIQKDFVQPSLWNLFVRFVYAMENNINLSKIRDISMKVANEYIGDKFSLEHIEQFNVVKDNLILMNNVHVYLHCSKYKQRIKDKLLK